MNKDLLIKFANRNCSVDEAREVLAWLETSDHEFQLEKMVEEDLVETLKSIGYEENRKLQKILRRIPLDDNKEIDHPQQSRISDLTPILHGIKRSQKQRVTSITSFILKIAASLIILVTLTFLIRDLNKNDQNLAEVSKEVKENTEGRKSTIYLKDGSIVHLNSNSKISYYTSFSDTLRAIELQGEAFFKVAKDSLRPFVVYTGDIVVKAVGTSFNIKNYDEEAQIYVALESGRVLVKEYKNKLMDQDEIYLDPGKEVWYNKSDSHFSDVKNANLKAASAWKDGTIYFVKADLETVIAELERWYGVQIDLKNQPDFKWNYTAEFQNLTLEEILESISFSQDFTYKMKAKYVEIIFN